MKGCEIKYKIEINKEESYNRGEMYGKIGITSKYIKNQGQDTKEEK